MKEPNYFTFDYCPHLSMENWFCLLLFQRQKITAPEIVKNIESGKWTATEVVSAYIRQAIEAHERTNCLTESECRPAALFLCHTPRASGDSSFTIIRLLTWAFKPSFLLTACYPTDLLVLFQEARKEAKELDQQFVLTKEVKGKLHGGKWGLSCITEVEVVCCLWCARLYDSSNQLQRQLWVRHVHVGETLGFLFTCLA